MSREHTQEIEIHAPASAVWKALTDADELTRWLAQSAQVDSATRTFQVTFGDGAQLTSRIDLWEPDKRLRLVSNLPTPEPVIEEYILEERGDTTVLRIVTSGIPDSPDWDGFFEGTSKGRGLSLLGLRHYLERHRGQPRWFNRVGVPADGSAAGAWARAVGPHGLNIPNQPGAHYRLSTASGDVLEGKILGAVDAYGLLATVDSLDDGLLALGIQAGPTPHVWLGLTSFGARRPALDQLDRDLRPLLERALSP